MTAGSIFQIQEPVAHDHIFVAIEGQVEEAGLTAFHGHDIPDIGLVNVDHMTGGIDEASHSQPEDQLLWSGPGLPDRRRRRHIR